MSCLEKLIINGIRSFSPDRREGIAFESPITLIVGQNGSGKTTIIECLKVSITGELPPSSKCGQCFIHDPKLKDKAELRGQIRLLFRDYQMGKKIQVIRSFQLSHIKNKKFDNTDSNIKSQFKVLESILQTKDDNTGEVTSISQKCADINSQVPILFGVSNSVIENVLFCHQEDSNWPLQEMSKVKKRFDELFGSTRYSKALEYIIKLKNDYSKKIKERAFQNDNIKQKITFLESAIEKKHTCLFRRQEIAKEIDFLNSKLKVLRDKKDLKNRTKDILDNLFNELTSETKLMDSYLKDINEMKFEFEFSKYQETNQVLDLESMLSIEQERSDVLNDQLNTIQNEIFCLQNEIEVFNNCSVNEFNRRVNELNNKLEKIKNRELLPELETFIEKLQDILREKLIHYKDLDWNKFYKHVFNMEFKEPEISKENLKHLKEKLELKLQEKENILFVIQQNKDQQELIKKDLDILNSQLLERNNIQNEIDDLRIKIENNKENSNEQNFVKNFVQNVKNFDSIHIQQLKYLYNITYELGVLDGEISILEFIDKYKKFDFENFDFNNGINNFEKMIELKKEEYKSKEPEVLSSWKMLESVDGLKNFGTKNDDFYVLQARYTLLCERIKNYEDNLETQKISLEDRLNRNIEKSSGELQQNVQKIELECQELNDRIQLIKINRQALEIEFNRKKEDLNNILVSIEHDFEYLFINKFNFEICDKQNIKQNMELLKSKQKSEKEMREKLKELDNKIETLKKMILFCRKKEKYSHSKSIVQSKKRSIIDLLYSEKPRVLNMDSFNMEDIEEKYRIFKEEIGSMQEQIETTMCDLSRLKGESKVNEDWLIKCESDSQGYTSTNFLLDEYSRGVFEQNLIAICIKDMEKYYSSLQKALMKFHINKMTEINRTIKELWNITYKGHDIDYIAIRSDAEDDEVTSNSSNKSSRTPSITKSFNYRVVMIQNGVELEMKGRCSAGQRVLACIVIRLALAESFCTNCGILALDEPTTNLDRFNMEGLAEALSYLIKFRKQQKNFQLIIITHDERFVRIIAQAQQCDHFYQISKDEQGYSEIRQVNFHGY